MSRLKNTNSEHVRLATALNYADMPLQVTHSRFAAVHSIPDLSVRNGLNFWTFSVFKNEKSIPLQSWPDEISESFSRGTVGCFLELIICCEKGPWTGTFDLTRISVQVQEEIE
jgi:hypothetical protein